MHIPTIMAVHAHPDDECFGGGATLARYSAQGYNTILVTCTSGEEGEIVDPDMDVETVRPHLGDVRIGELNAAVGVLGIKHLELLGYRDSGMVDTPANENPLSFNKADPEEATGRLVALIRRHKPDVLFSYAEDGGYGHPDHLMAHRITVAAFDAAGDPARYPDAGEPWTPRKLYYSTWLTRSQVQALWHAVRALNLPNIFSEPDATEPPEWGVPDDELTACIDVSAFVGRKIDSLRAHRTQIKQDFFMFQLPEDIAREHLSMEGFRRAQSRVPAPERENDLFEGIGQP